MLGVLQACLFECVLGCIRTVPSRKGTQARPAHMHMRSVAEYKSKRDPQRAACARAGAHCGGHSPHVVLVLICPAICWIKQGLGDIIPHVLHVVCFLCYMEHLPFLSLYTLQRAWW